VLKHKEELSFLKLRKISFIVLVAKRAIDFDPPENLTQLIAYALRVANVVNTY